MYGISGRFNTSNTKLPIYIEMMTDQKICGSSIIRRGPGLTLSAINAPNRIAVVPDPGIPSVRSGTNEPVHAALLAVSGAARPLIDPLPNSSCSSLVAMLRSTAYPKKLAIVAPAPGRTPMKKPCSDWRAMTGAIARASVRVMRISLILPDAVSLISRGRRTKNNASGKANIAIANVMNPNPDCRSMMPMVKRGILNKAPSPTVAMIRPSAVIITAFATWPVPAKAAMADSPTIMSAKYSEE